MHKELFDANNKEMVTALAQAIETACEHLDLSKIDWFQQIWEKDGVVANRGVAG